jgi:deoxyhypusine synthase
VLEYRTEFHASYLGLTQTAANDTTVEMLGRVAGQLSSSGLTDSLQQSVSMYYLDRVVTAQANALGFQDGFFLLALVALAPLVPVSCLIRSRLRKR